MSINVRETNRFVPQLITVVMEKALPLIPAGKISLNTNQDTVDEKRDVSVSSSWPYVT